MTTIKQKFQDLLNNDWNDTHFDETDLTNIIKEWLTQKRQEIKKKYNVEWSEQANGAYKQIDELLEELQK